MTYSLATSQLEQSLSTSSVYKRSGTIFLSIRIYFASRKLKPPESACSLGFVSRVSMGWAKSSDLEAPLGLLMSSARLSHLVSLREFIFSC